MFDEIVLGRRERLGSYTFTPEAIIAFARNYDPQPFHLSEEGGAATHFGGLVASGWHTGSVWMRMRVDQWQRMAGRTRGEGPAAAGERPLGRLQEPQMAAAGARRRHHHLLHRERGRSARWRPGRAGASSPR
jgi:hypothetical protein